MEKTSKSTEPMTSAGVSSHRELVELLHVAERRKAPESDATLDGILSRLGVEA